MRVRLVDLNTTLTYFFTISQANHGKKADQFRQNSDDIKKKSLDTLRSSNTKNVLLFSQLRESKM